MNKSNTLEKIIRKYIKPPFWILEYRHTGNGRSESGLTALLADPADKMAANKEAEKYIRSHVVFKGEYSYSLRLAHWWERLY